MAYLVSGQMYDAEDIVQETFVKCFLHIGDLKKNEGFRPWSSPALLFIGNTARHVLPGFWFLHGSCLLRKNKPYSPWISNTGQWWYYIILMKCQSRKWPACWDVRKVRQSPGCLQQERNWRISWLCWRKEAWLHSSFIDLFPIWTSIRCFKLSEASIIYQRKGWTVYLCI